MLRLEASPARLCLHSYKFHTPLLSRDALSGRACSYSKASGEGKGWAGWCAAVPAHSPARSHCDHQNRACRSPSDVCSGKKLSTKLVKTTLRAAGNVQKARSALACWAVPMSPLGDAAAGWEALQLPAAQRSGSPPSQERRRHGQESCPGPPAQKTGLLTCSDGAWPEPPAWQSQTSLAQRLILDFIINLINEKTSWSNFCCVCASVLKELLCVQVTVLFTVLRTTEENSLHDKYSERKANLD